MSLLSKPVKFVEDVNHEMSKVSWPTYKDLKNSTIIVIVLSLFFVVFIFAADWLLNLTIKMIF